jgi:FHA domain-containing protein
MIALKVLSYNGTPADGPAAQFDELGGSIGRADTNQLVLPDPERTISRVHARIVFRAGGYSVVDNGSNPISVNGQVLGSGREVPLRPGDQLQIGGYVLQASDTLAPDVSDPFAVLFGDATGLATPVAPQVPRPIAAASMARPTALTPARGAGPAPNPSPSPPFVAGHIPEDWDPFAPDPHPLQPQSSPGANATASGGLLDMPAQRADSLDDLFGLGPTAPISDPLLAFGAAPPPARSELLGPAPQADPFARAGGADGGSELNTPMPLQARRAATASPDDTAPATPALPAGAVFSWQGVPAEGRVVTLPGAGRHEADAAHETAAARAPIGLDDDFGFDLPLVPPSASQQVSALQPAEAPGALLRAAASPSPTSAPRPGLAAPASPPSRAADAEVADGLLQALLEGLEMPDLRLGRLDEPTMRLIGQLLRESTRGAVELLVARAALKREMRAEMTMIVARENNPLKFSPSVEVALQHLLGPPTPGFMPAAPAVRDAFDDLRAHQLGVMAGMRAGLEGVLQRFDPQQLEGKLAPRSGLGSLIPAARKARLWELFQELFGQLQREAEDDFDELFGRAFVRAYEAQLDRLQAESDSR